MLMGHTSYMYSDVKIGDIIEYDETYPHAYKAYGFVESIPKPYYIVDNKTPRDLMFIIKWFCDDAIRPPWGINPMHYNDKWRVISA